MAETFNLLAGLQQVGSKAGVQVTGSITIDLSDKWINRTFAVGIAKQIRSNLLKGLDPDGKPMPPLKSQDSISPRSLERTSKLRGKHAKAGKHLRGIETGLLMRSIVSASVGVGAEVYVKGDRGMRHGNDPSAAETTFVLSSGTNLFRVENLEQVHIQAAIRKIAERIVDQKVQAEMDDVMAGLQ